MQTNFFSCIKHTDNTSSKKATVTNKLIREKLICASCVAEKLRSF